MNEKVSNETAFHPVELQVVEAPSVIPAQVTEEAHVQTDEETGSKDPVMM
ncbi:MAG: hypothetical protein ACREHG_09500 [Candidatus Saccharimonadales bacterium]